VSHLIAHTPAPGSARWHLLLDHILSVAEMARDFAQPFGGDSLAYLVGLWHDVGKANPDFQDYLRRCHADPSHKGRGPDHKAAGAMLAQQFFPPLALLVQGHHGGLSSKTELASWLEEKKKLTVSGTENIAVEAAIAALAPLLPQIEPTEKPKTPAYVRDQRSAEFFLRMLFSTLVDADFLDTEAHGNPHKATQRGSDVPLATLLERFERDQAQLIGGPGPVNQARDAMYGHCIKAAAHMPGLFRLAMPTGGGKTRAGMGFALHHAVRHNKHRIIVVVPYISITEQTAQEYRTIFQDNDDPHPIVLEHHSGADAARNESDDYLPGTIWSRLAAENWDAPIIVTTTVQLFESMFGSRTGVCRKLHRLANSVIILDESQSLPTDLLTPILDGLRELCSNYGTTVVLSTATQPAFDSVKVFKDLPAYDIVPDAARYFTALSRVRYEWRTQQPTSWSDVATMLRAEPQALAVVNTKGDVLTLLDTLGDDPTVLHLSTLLCGAHRHAVIAKVKRRLKNGEPCRLVSTQVIEAGVDLDFPLVLRAMGPLDRIIQAAGRCNREGKLPEKGKVIVFQSEDGRMPPGVYRASTQITSSLINAGSLDLDDPGVVSAYFRRLYTTFKDPHGQLDKKGIQALRQDWNFAEVAQRMRLIEEDTEDVIVSYGDAEAQAKVQAAIADLRRQEGSARGALRRLQPYLVSVRARVAEQYRRQGWIEPVLPESKLNIGIWHGLYDETRGLIADDDRSLLVFG
jgi:CRISPR-associated endonuclease/helicase Cas3